MKLFAFADRGPIGIDIGGQNIKAVQMSDGPEGRRVEAVATFPRVEVNSPLSRLEVQRLADVLYRRSFTGNRVVLAVPGDKQITGTMELPARSAGISLDAAAKMEFSRAYKCEANTFEMAYWDLPAAARAARTTNVMAVAYPHAEADALIDLFASAKLDVVGLDTRSWAMARACYPAVQDSSGIVILLDIGWNGALLVMLHQGTVIYERPLTEAGLKNLTGTLETELKISAALAQHVLGHSGLSTRLPAEARGVPKVSVELQNEVRLAAEAHFELVSQELLESVSYTTHQYPEAPASGLLLMGGGAMIPGIAEHMALRVGFECRTVSPLESAKCGPGLVRECYSALTTAAGLSLFESF